MILFSVNKILLIIKIGKNCNRPMKQSIKKRKFQIHPLTAFDLRNFSRSSPSEDTTIVWLVSSSELGKFENCLEGQIVNAFVAKLIFLIIKFCTRIVSNTSVVMFLVVYLGSTYFILINKVTFTCRKNVSRYVWMCLHSLLCFLSSIYNFPWS